MNIRNRIRLNFYPELKDLNLSDELLDQILSNKYLKDQYKTEIKPFIKYLREYKYYKFENGMRKEIKLDMETMSQHIKAVFELSIQNNSSKYISFVTKNGYASKQVPNIKIFNDSNFEKIYSRLGVKTFNESICEIIENGNSNRLIQFINNNDTTNINNLNSEIFSDKVWNIISKNPLIGDIPVLKLFDFKINELVDIIKQDYYEGMKYTYENIPESHNFIEKQIGAWKKEAITYQQFSMDFIQNIGDNALKKLYERGEFTRSEEFKKLFQIASIGNYELILDIINYDKYNFSFSNIATEDMKKPLLETDINGYNKREIFLNKYLGVEQLDIQYVKLFLESINKLEKIPDSFVEKYGNLLQLMNLVLSSTDEDLIKFSKEMDKGKREEYTKLVKACEKDGNEILKENFVEDLQKRNQQIIETANHKKITTSEGKMIDVYELTGQPFTMLVHAITNNSASENNSYVKQIINNPEEWDKIVEGNNHISTSLISNQYMKTYGGAPNSEGTLMFGFSEVPRTALKLTDISDVGINRNAPTSMSYNIRNRLFIPSINTVATIDELMQKTIKKNATTAENSKTWNEVVLSRSDEETGGKLEPSFIVCMDRISESSKKAAEKLNIPIYFIHRNCYQTSPYSNESTKELEEMLTETQTATHTVNQKKH